MATGNSSHAGAGRNGTARIPPQRHEHTSPLAEQMASGLVTDPLAQVLGGLVTRPGNVTAADERQAGKDASVGPSTENATSRGEGVDEGPDVANHEADPENATLLLSLWLLRGKHQEQIPRAL